MAGDGLPRGFEFREVGRPRTMDAGGLAHFRSRSPFLHWLLTTQSLTTGAIERRTGYRLSSRRWVGARGGILVRRHALSWGRGVVVEVAEVEIPAGVAAWASVPEALGPWLVRQGWRVEKRDIRPLAFPNVPVWRSVFPGSAAWAEVPGRAYGLMAIRANVAIELRVMEAWNPALLR